MNTPGRILWSDITTAARDLGLLPLGVIDLAMLESSPAWKSATLTWQSAAKSREKHLQGAMSYLDRHTDVRQHPTQLVPGATIALSFALPCPRVEMAADPTVARFARIPDYHKTIAALLARLESTLRASHPNAFTVWRSFVDTPPLWERVVAASTGSGFIGRNACFIHRDAGSFVLLGEVITDAQVIVPRGDRSEELIPGSPGSGCGSCRACVGACPTGAITGDGVVDASRCLSYWTMEHRGPIPREFWPLVSECLYGCDRCQDVCPFNAECPESNSHTTATPRQEFQIPDLFDIAVMNEQAYQKSFGGTALIRAKRAGLRRNALIALAHRADPRLHEALASVADDDEILQQTKAQMAGNT